MLTVRDSLLVAAFMALGCSQSDDAPTLGRASPALAEERPAGEPGGVLSADATAAEVPVPSSPVVDLSGVTTLPGELPPGTTRLAALAWVTPVMDRPSGRATRIGALRAGAVVGASAEPVGTDGCPSGWRAIEPAGYVCVGHEATLDLDHETVRAASRRPDLGHRLPYMYGIVTRGGPIYARLPSADDLRKLEPNLADHLRKWRDDDESGAAYGLDVWLRYAETAAPAAWQAYQDRITEPSPWFLRDGRQVPNLSGLVKTSDDVKIDEASRRTGRSFVDSFLHEGRRYNVTPDLVVVPADRLRPIRGSSYRGVRIGEDVDFPFAMVRRPGARKWLWSSSRNEMVDGGALPWRSVVALTDKKRFHGKVLHYEAKEGFWVDEQHAGRVDPAKRWPKWAQEGQKWVDVRLSTQVLVAYEGMKAVYATLVSSGEAGLADADKTTATKTGIFRVHTKWVSTTMSSSEVGEEFELRDVPYVQYFEGGYALHGAYWHDGFGRPKSHGCINLSPEDARRLFHWTEPVVPPTWHGAQKALTGTIVFVHR